MESSKYGLAPIVMDRLSQLVLLAGRNGSGKSRILRAVRTAFDNQPKESSLALSRLFISRTESMDRHRTLPQERQYQNQKAILDWNLLSVEGRRDALNIVNYVPEKNGLTDPAKLSPNDEEKHANMAAQIGVHHLKESTLSFISLMHKKKWVARHPDSTQTEHDKSVIISDYNALDNTIYDLLGTRLGNSETNAPTLFGFPIGRAQLSSGQTLLLQLAVAVHQQGSNLAEMILHLDEPENHFHPAAIIDVVERLLEKNIKGQIWMATHSVSILGEFASRGSLWYVDGGKISRTGKIQEKVLEGLLGGPERIERQKEFLEGPERIAFMNYVAECLVPPEPLLTGSDDPQINQIHTAIERLYTTTHRIKVLDYGVGKGRLLNQIAGDPEKRDKFVTKVDYIALDLSAKHAEECKAIIRDAYGATPERWFGSINALRSEHNNKSFDLIVMCNVLHEIHPMDWLDLFGVEGKLTRLLGDDGRLLIVEVQQIPYGEHAHKDGFIVLDTGSLKELFGIVGPVSGMSVDKQSGGWLKSHLIPKQYLEKCTIETLKSALKSHKVHAKEEMDRLRRENDPHSGKLWPFWILQLANTTSALEGLH